MKSLKELYKIGYGPSSSHTMGPTKAIKWMAEKYPDSFSYKVVLYGSLALTGKGHFTDVALKKAVEPFPCFVEFDYDTPTDYCSNTLDITSYFNGEEHTHRFYSVGGGTIEIEGLNKETEKDVYPHNSLEEIKKYMEENKLNILDYILSFEDKHILTYINKIYVKMLECIDEGLQKDGLLPGELGVSRRAKAIYEANVSDKSLLLNQRIYAYAYAVSEENACGGEVVTAPTCGSCGLMPGLLKALQEEYSFSNEKICEALLVGGLIGNLVKENASISGAACGCQAEIGTACAMGAAASAYLFGGTIEQIEASAEIALEHLLGLTCDPIKGYVQIPCIERNAVCAVRALDAAKLVVFIDPKTTKISFDMVVKTMLKTGTDLDKEYKETSLGGLAKEYFNN